MLRVLSALLLQFVLLAGIAHASPAPRSIMQDDLTLLRKGPEARERALDEMRALGVDAIRVLVVWRDHAPAPRARKPPPEATAGKAEPARGAGGATPARGAGGLAAGPLAALDAVLAGAAARGMDVLLTPTGPGPAWASRCATGTVEERQACRPDPPQFGEFVEALATRYPQQRHWAIWNEPNNARWLSPQFDPRGRPAAPDWYRQLVRAARQALVQTGHAKDELLIGETAPLGKVLGPPATRPMPPGRFLRNLLCTGCGTLGATGLSHHAYTRGGTKPPRTPAARDELSIAALGEVVKLARGLPVHLTEGGWQTRPPDPLFGVTLAEQARFTNETEWIVRNQPKVRSVAQYLLHDELRTSGFQSGLRFVDGRPKPSLDAYRLPIWVTRTGTKVTIWGRARPATNAPVEVQRRRGRGPWRTLATAEADDDILVTRRAASGVWRLKTPTATSRTAGEARR